MNDKWVEFAIRIQSIAQAGLQYGCELSNRIEKINSEKLS